ncbi:ABC transporter permease [Actibacterium mucosum KCTC 23349]|uniref:ABC transporter permease n=1 Tax=Actibacterium mucosum KCTC 23349 TaxID=1454373 RepID=A0A037ZP23_9RHOB|nr:ABC transporter permease [Actibacterium mucosum]KAJ57303.1 ABC transporter permease [Actibacterium mucosum KCTC 23349]
MFVQKKYKSPANSAFALMTLIYHASVRHVRRTHGNPLLGLISNVMQTVLFVAVFYVMFEILGLRGMAIRGDFLLYLMTGIFLFITHNKSLGAIVGSEGPTSPMMQHAPMNTIVAISAAAISTLYIQILSVFVILLVYHVAFTPITIEEPVGAMGMVILAWFSGVAIGLLLLALKPWAPGLVGMISTVYQRANMISSGKMFLANTLPGSMLALFDWNPLFHAIDQARGFTFINYNPHFSSITYPLYLSLALIIIGLMGEFYTRKHASASWFAGK